LDKIAFEEEKNSGFKMVFFDMNNVAFDEIYNIFKIKSAVPVVLGRS
jgi:hypothetical protein